jgi:hypothetical protein
MEEIWKDIKGYEGLYQVSNLGNVKSLPKEWVCGNGHTLKHDGKILKKMLNSSTYLGVNLRKNNKPKTFQVHQLVAMTFLGHQPCGHKIVIDHINDNKLDNRVENLQIVSHRFNTHKTQTNYTSKYKGVFKLKSTWKATISIDGRQIHLGCFNCELAAAAAYQNKLKEITNK